MVTFILILVVAISIVFMSVIKSVELDKKIKEVICGLFIFSSVFSYLLGYGSALTIAG